VEETTPQHPAEHVADEIAESSFSTISYAEAGIQPKLSCFNRADPGRKHVELTQGVIMWAFLTIIDRHGSQLRDIDVHTTGGNEVVCQARQLRQAQVATTRCRDDDMRNLFAEDFRFALGGAGGCPNPYPGCLAAVGAVQHVIENLPGPVGFRITISTDESSPNGADDSKRIEQWAVVLHSMSATTTMQEFHKEQAVVAMRTLYAFSRLIGPRTTRALQFEIVRIRPDAVCSVAKRAAAVTTTFGCVSVDLEFTADDSTMNAPSATPRVESVARPVTTTTGQLEQEQEPEQEQEQEPEHEQFSVSRPASWKDIDTPSEDVEDGEISGPGAKVGQYDVTQYLGKGAFGLVWKAAVRGMENVDVAIKTIDRAKVRTAKEKQLVQDEIRSMQSISHPNVVRLFEPLYSETHVLMVLEFCETDLKNYMYAPLQRGLPSRAPLCEEEAKCLMQDFAAGLRELRAHSIIHRDLKDENLLIATVDGARRLKIADFGFAKQLAGDLTNTFTEVGSPAYMAPEVLAILNPALQDGTGLPGRGAGYDAKADLWSVGCILYGMLCKRLVFSDDVRTKQDLVHELAQEMRDGTQKSLPEFVECEDGRGFDGPASRYNQGAEESSASRECRLVLAAEAAVADDRVWIIGGTVPEKNAALRSQGKVVIKYKRAVDVSAACRDLLGGLLQHNPQQRIDWADFFAHPWLQ
jgi:serine/threonine protein kinase